ncbi:MAG: hypothetical protein Q9195_005294 [Heterodermia aff. obscurata]
MIVDRFQSDVGKGNMHSMLLRFGRHLTEPYVVRQVPKGTQLPEEMRHDQKTQANLEAGELYSFSLFQKQPCDFELETAVVITNPFVDESLRILRLVRVTPSVTIYVKRYGKLFYAMPRLFRTNLHTKREEVVPLQNAVITARDVEPTMRRPRSHSSRQRAYAAFSVKLRLNDREHAAYSKIHAILNVYIKTSKVDKLFRMNFQENRLTRAHFHTLSSLFTMARVKGMKDAKGRGERIETGKRKSEKKVKWNKTNQWHDPKIMRKFEKLGWKGFESITSKAKAERKMASHKSHKKLKLIIDTPSRRPEEELRNTRHIRQLPLPPLGGQKGRAHAEHSSPGPLHGHVGHQFLAIRRPHPCAAQISFQRDAAARLYNDTYNPVRVLLTSVGVAATSINLRGVYYRVVFLELNMNANTMMQAIGHVFRIGQPPPIFLIMECLNHTHRLSWTVPQYKYQDFKAIPTEVGL